MRIRARLIGAAAFLSLVIAGSGCTTSPFIPSPPDGLGDTGPPPPPPPPQTFTLSGIVTEATPTGQVPIEGVTVEADVCPHASLLAHSVYALVSTDSEGRYTVSGMCSGATSLWVYKEGYRDKDETLPLCLGYPCYTMTLVGDTRFDVELVRLSEPSAP